MKVVSLAENERNRSSLIKTNTHTFILKNMGIGTYGTDRVARLFILLPSGDKALVQTISLLRLIESKSLESTSIDQDCLIWQVLTFEEAIEESKKVIRKIY